MIIVSIFMEAKGKQIVERRPGASREENKSNEGLGT